MSEFLRRICTDKIKINHNKEPIKMDAFLSFLTVETKQPEGDWLGKCNGWTKHIGEGELYITGGLVGGVEYLDHILYGKNLENPYNNYVTPFSLFSIMTEGGRLFFLEYYKDEIANILKGLQAKVDRAIVENNETVAFWNGLKQQAKEVRSEHG